MKIRSTLIPALFILTTVVSGTYANILTGTEWAVNQYNHTAAGGSYFYNLGKHEITQGQWDSFVTDVGAGSLYGHSGNIGTLFGGPYTWGANQPAAQMSWYEAAQFCNWLTSGNVDDGAYTFNPDNSVSVNRAGARSLYSSVYAIPTYDEWRIAAYYNGSGFTTYATGETAPTGWNYDTGTYVGGGVNPLGLDSNIQAPEYPNSIFEPWAVGIGTEEQNGTYDMMGNVWEWIEDTNSIIGGSAHGDNHISSSDPLFPGGWNANDESSWLGFRVVEVGTNVIPEPASVSLIALISGGALLIRRWFMI